MSPLGRLATIVAVGRDCYEFLPDCLASIEAQDYEPLEVVVIDDASDDARQPAMLRAWSFKSPARFSLCSPVRHGAMENIDIAVRHLARPGEGLGSVVILVDLDDALAVPEAVSRIMTFYEPWPGDPALRSEDIVATYGQLHGHPEHPGLPLARPYPADVIDARGFRYVEAARFNHPLTFTRAAYLTIPPAEFHRPDGRWVQYVYDEAIMYPLLELAGRRHVFVPDVLYRYTTNNPLSCNATPERAAAMVAEAAELRARPSLYARGIRLDPEG